MIVETKLLIFAAIAAYGFFARRKANQDQKKRAEAAQKAQASGSAPSGLPRSAIPPAAAPPAMTPTRRETISGRSSYDEDDSEDQQEWEEHHQRGEARGEDRDARPSRGGRMDATPNRGPEPTRSQPAETRKSAGKDLLAQLAKELGLEMPAPQPRPPKPAASRAPASKPSQVQSIPRQTNLDKVSRESGNRVVQKHTERPVDRSGGENSPRRPGNLPVTAAVEARSVPGAAMESLMDMDSLRRAFILKTILDKPLSLQPRRPGEG